MTSELIRRLAVLPLLLWAVVTLVFVLLRILPGDAATMLTAQVASQEVRDRIVIELGLDQSLWQQYLIYLGDLLRLDAGVSYISGRSVTSLIYTTLPVTIELAVAAALIMAALGLTSGMLAAAFRGSWIDTAVRFVATVLFSVPWFWLGIVLILVFSVQLGWLPSFGRMPPSVIYDPVTNFVLIDAILLGQPQLIWPWLQHLILPALTVGLTTAGFVTRITRASFLEVMVEDFVRTARMKGMSGSRVFWRHICRNAALPIVTIVGLMFGAMLGGSVIAEVVFAYPGIGRMMVDAIFQRDYSVVQGAALVIACLYILVNLATDLSYALIDPRLRTA